MSDLITAIQKAIADICAARLCEVNSMSSRQEMLRLMIQATDTLRAALAQEEQEPVAWVDEASIAWLAEHPRGIITTRLVKQKSPERQMAMYAEPPRREWQSLTENEILFATQHCGPGNAQTILVARAVESLLKEKNNV